ncbi:hypothetical protein ACFQLX_17230 [Streptomyces polyrhachis]|uniref:PBP domain-containing protein n=1 Tax=Streptomyces polyrhachis TaxID=1282885 RepID=A0ABW2GGL0_9ACTN
MKRPALRRIRGPIRRPIRVLLPALAAFALALPAALLAPGPQALADSGSARTVRGAGDFADLEVTVAQTRQLVNQIVKVSWKGAAPTIDDTRYAADYLQIMQCWGEKESGPDPEQCQFGGSAAAGPGLPSRQAGAWTNTRQLDYGGLRDTAWRDGEAPPRWMPFRTPDGEEHEGNYNAFYDLNSTNEVPYARTGNSGRGEVFFEMQTSAEAPGLGCGEVAAAGAKPRGCWLVVVPRGEKEVSGGPYRTDGDNGMLASSPLSPSNWAQRLVVPLEFEPIGIHCPLGAAERPTSGHELIAEAVLRWQPTLCAGARRTVYGFNQLSDDTARSRLASDDPRLVFLNRPAPLDTLPQGAEPLYAPVALSGLTLAFFIESRSPSGAPEEVRSRDGNRITSLNLTPRLVAKLLTQSYGFGNHPFAESTRGNPLNLMGDPEFLEHNPDFEGLDFNGALGDAMVPQSIADSTWQLWEWINSDPAAREFLNGIPDTKGEHGEESYTGMKVNPNYRDLALPISDFPKSDPFCVRFDDRPDNPLCTIDRHPYALDMHTTARSVARGDTLARMEWDPGSPGTSVPGYKKSPPQAAGQRALLGVTDTTSAARYGLVTARLQNAAGNFVAPTGRSLLAGAAAMRPSGVPGVLSTVPTAKDPQAYPLPLLSYAATVPERLTKAEGADYAALLDYAVGDGQRPGTANGTLPAGYVPLPEGLRAQTAGAADALRARAGTGPHSTPGPDDGSATQGASGTSTAGGGDAGGVGGTDTSGGGDGATGASGDDGAAGTPAGGDSAAPVPVADAQPTASTPGHLLGAVRFALLIALITGLAAAVCGPLLPRIAPRLAAARRSGRTAPLPAPGEQGTPHGPEVVPATE